jgi:FAD/FMN-containing dehydrogenase
LKRNSRFGDSNPRRLFHLDAYALWAARLGGRVSGEHGIGHKRKAAMPKFVSPEYLAMIRSVKKALDPNSILNPGKIFDPE